MKNIGISNNFLKAIGLSTSILIVGLIVVLSSKLYYLNEADQNSDQSFSDLLTEISELRKRTKADSMHIALLIDSVQKVNNAIEEKQSYIDLLNQNQSLSETGENEINDTYKRAFTQLDQLRKNHKVLLTTMIQNQDNSNFDFCSILSCSDTIKVEGKEIPKIPIRVAFGNLHTTTVDRYNFLVKDIIEAIQIKSGDITKSKNELLKIYEADIIAN